MERKVQISGGLFAGMMAVLLHVSQLLYLPTDLIQTAGQDAWIAIILSSLGGSLVGLFAIWVSLRYPGLFPAQIARRCLGKVLGGALGLFFVSFYLWLYTVVLRDVLDFTQIALLQGTPGLVLAGLMAAAVLYAVWEGLEPTARISVLVIPTVIVAVSLIPAFVYKEFNSLHLEPILWNGFPNILLAALRATPWFADAVVVMTLVPTLKRPDQAYRWFLIGAAVATALLLILLITTIAVFSKDLSARFLFPVYMLIQQVRIGRNVERIEVILLAIWLCGMFLKLAISLYAASTTASHALGLRSHRLPAVVLAVSGVLMTQIWRTPLDLVYMTTTRRWVVSTLAVQISMPALLLLASLVDRARRRKGRLHA